MADQARDVQCKIKILRYAEQSGCVAKTCRYFGIGRASFYRWRTAYRQLGEAGLVNAKPIPKNPVNRAPPEIVDKVLHLRSTYHLGPIRIVWYLARYHGIKISEAGVSRILRRNGVSRLPRGTRLRKIHSKRYNKQVPGHQIQMDVKFLTFEGPRGEKIRRFQYTAIHDATHILALKIYEEHTQAIAIDFVDHIIEKFPFRIREIRTDNVTNSKPSSIGISRSRAFATRTSSAARRSCMEKSSALIAQTRKGFTSSCRTRMMSISKPNSTNGSTSTISDGHMAHSTVRRLTKRSGNGYRCKRAVSRQFVKRTEAPYLAGCGGNTRSFMSYPQPAIFAFSMASSAGSGWGLRVKMLISPKSGVVVMNQL